MGEREEEEKGWREEGVGSRAERESEERSWRRRRRMRERRRRRVGPKVLIVCPYVGHILEPIRGTIKCAGTFILRLTVHETLISTRQNAYEST